MDGVIYRERQLIPGAERFISSLLDRGIPFAFLTNNSQRTRRDVAMKLSRMGIFVDESHIFTCAMATARFLAAQKPRGTAFVSGEGGLTQALHKNGYAIVDDDPDYVVVGEGRRGRSRGRSGSSAAASARPGARRPAGPRSTRRRPG